MHFEIYDYPFPHIIIRETFNEEELELIWKELKLLDSDLTGPDQYDAAKAEDGTYLTKAKGLSLDKLYRNRRSSSDILNITQEVLFNSEFLDSMIEYDNYWVTYAHSNQDFTKVRKYFPGDGYAAHSDYWVNAIASTTLCDEEDMGGNLYFPRHDFWIKTRNNETAVFPGWVEHSVTKIIDYERYAITKFISCTNNV